MRQEKTIVKRQKGATRMQLFTFIMNYLGGTYIDQVVASNETEAMRVWIKQLDSSEIKGFSALDKKRIINNNFDDEIPVSIKGVKNVWFCLIDTKKGYGHVNIIKTCH